MHKAFRTHLYDSFTCCPDLLVQEFNRYLAFPYVQEVEVAGCKGLVTECEVCNVLKQVSLNKSPGLDGLPHQVYLRMLHMFVLILIDIFNHWFTQGAIPASVIKGGITLLKKQVCLGGFRWLEFHNSIKHRVKDFGLGLSELFAVCC